MNSLNINLEEGQKVLMEGTCSEEDRTVTIEGGFGLTSYTSGSGLFVKLPDGSSAKMNGMEIEKLVE